MLADLRTAGNLPICGMLWDKHWSQMLDRWSRLILMAARGDGEMNNLILPAWRGGELQQVAKYVEHLGANAVAGFLKSTVAMSVSEHDRAGHSNIGDPESRLSLISTSLNHCPRISRTRPRMPPSRQTAQSVFWMPFATIDI